EPRPALVVVAPVRPPGPPGPLEGFLRDVLGHRVIEDDPGHRAIDGHAVALVERLDVDGSVVCHVPPLTEGYPLPSLVGGSRRSGRRRSERPAASKVRARAASSDEATAASRNWIPWSTGAAPPAAVTRSSRAPRASPNACPEMPIRPESSAVMATAKPCPAPP